jgi:hypothetical protein
MIHNWDVDQVIAECRKMYRGANDSYETGWNNWPCKQDLYRVKFAVEEMLQNTSKFTPEDEWLKEQEQQRMWQTLKKS